MNDEGADTICKIKDPYASIISPFGSQSHHLVQRFNRFVYNESLDRIFRIKSTQLTRIAGQCDTLAVGHAVDLEDGDATEGRGGLDGRPVLSRETCVGEVDTTGVQSNTDCLCAASAVEI